VLLVFDAKDGFMFFEGFQLKLKRILAYHWKYYFIKQIKLKN